MKIVVMKFGGTSVSDISKIKNVASIINKNYKKYKLVIVLSAMAGVTNDLQKLIDQIDYPSSKENDLILTSGEQVTVGLLSMVLNKMKIKSMPLLGWQVPIITDSSYEKAKILNDSGIPYGLNAIIGLPGETREMVFETIELIRQIEGYDGIGVSIFIPYCGTKLREYAVEKGWLDNNWISGSGYLLGGSALNMPKPYLQNDEIWHLSERFKHYCYFDKKYWDQIDKAENLDWFESIYNKEFYTKYAADGKTHIDNRYQSIYTFSSDKYGVIH